MSKHLKAMTDDSECIGSVGNFFVWRNGPDSYSVTDGVLGDEVGQAATEEGVMTLAREHAPE